MNNKEKAPTGAGTPAGAAKIVSEAYSHCSTSSGGCQILDYLSTGRQSAHTAAEIAEWMGNRPRDVTRMVERARLKGAPVCATCANDRPGYYLAESADELQAYLHSFRRRRRNMVKTEDALMNTLCNMTGQQRFDFGGDV